MSHGMGDERGRRTARVKPSTFDRKAEYERIGREREEASREADGIYLRDLLRTCGLCILSALLGLVPGAWAFHVTDPQLGRALLACGTMVTVGGIALTIHGAYRRGEERGDW
ncbi:MAG: hypothetical protein JWO05_2646 [Gemmatimonadetes bacterium]|nr:hypothetical protein [Gemmatimonadota bacterium]